MKINAKSIVDCAAGIGYGSYILAKNAESRITSIELSKQAYKTYADNYKLVTLTLLIQI